MSSHDTHSAQHCSFCGKSARQAKTLIAGQDGVAICNGCIALCKGIVEETTIDETPEHTLEGMRPSAIRAYLDDHIIGQDHAKVGLSVAVYNHFKRIRDTETTNELEPLDPASADELDDTELSKGNILMIGPTGTGKTLIARTLAKKLGVPFAIADATTLTEAGYVGEDVESIIKTLWIAAGKDAELASRGIICVDEIDKIARSGSSNTSVRDVGGEGVQQALLKIIEGQTVSIQPDGGRGRSQADAIEIDTTQILFVCCGAFEGLEDIIQQRLSQTPIGFGADLKRDDGHRNKLLRNVRAQDLVQFGLIPEFVGRVPVFVTLDELTEENLLDILLKPKNALLKQYQRLLELQNVRLEVEDDALKAIVARAVERSSGARGLRAIVEEVMLEIMYTLPSMDNVGTCIITKACVIDGADPTLLPPADDAA